MAMRLCFFGLASLGLALAQISSTPAKRFLIDQELFPDAKCLDGSPGVYYHRPAPKGSKASNRWIIVLQGGSQCRLWAPTEHETAHAHTQVAPGNCAHRVSTKLGTSKMDAEEMDLDFKEILSPDPAVNPVFNDWQVLFGRSCDGSTWVGNKDVHYEGDGDCPAHFSTEDGEGCRVYHMRGRSILEAMVSTAIRAHGMDSAAGVVMYGAGSGAYGALHGGSLVRGLLSGQSSFALLLDSFVEPQPDFPFVCADGEDCVEAMRSRIAAQRPDSVAQRIGATKASALAEYSGEAAGTKKFQSAWLALLRNHNAMFAGGKTIVGWIVNSTVQEFGQECLAWIVGEMGAGAEASELLEQCGQAQLGVAFSKVPAFLLQPAFDSYSANVGGQDDKRTICAKDPKCAAGWTKKGRKVEAQLGWSLSLRRKRSPGLPTGAFIDHCMHSGRYWHQLWDEQGVSNAQRLGEWLNAVDAWHVSASGGRQSTPNEKTAMQRVTWQRRGAKWPCEDCCNAQAN